MAQAVPPVNERRMTYLASGHVQMAAELKECGVGLLPHTRKKTDLHTFFKGLDINVLQHTHTQRKCISVHSVNVEDLHTQKRNLCFKRKKKIYAYSMQTINYKLYTV